MGVLRYLLWVKQDIPMGVKELSPRGIGGTSKGRRCRLLTPEVPPPKVGGAASITNRRHLFKILHILQEKDDFQEKRSANEIFFVSSPKISSVCIISREYGSITFED